MNNFRRSVVQDTRKQQSGGKGSRGTWHDRFRLPHNVATPFMFIAGKYPDPVDGSMAEYYKFKKHHRKLNANEFRDEVCSAGPNPHTPQPCVGCFAMDTGDRSVTVTNAFALTMVHLAPYHRHPLVDMKGGRGPVMKQDGTPVMIDSECTGRTCNFCHTMKGQQPIVPPGQQWPGYNPQDITTVFGKRRYMELGKNGIEDLTGWDKTVGSQCGTSNCHNQLTTDSFNCSHCGAVVIDMATDPRTDEQIGEATLRPCVCNQCHKDGFVVEKMSCDRCGQPKQLTIFDVVLWGMRQGQGTSTHLVLQRFEDIDTFAKSVPQPLLGTKTLRDRIAELGTPYNFPETMAARPLDKQAQQLQLPIPQSLQSPGGYTTSTAGSGYVAYSHPQAAQQGQQSTAQPPAFVPPSRPNFSR